VGNKKSRTDNDLVIETEGLTKTFQMGQLQVQALRQVSLQIGRGELVSIMGPSGSGKSTLMNILGCLDQPTAGEYHLAGIDVARLDDNQLAEIRGNQIGFVFQTFNLLPRNSALGNVELPLIYAGVARRQRHKLAATALELVGLADRLHHKPSELSGGQQQRVAIARALVNQPAIIMADEPTGNLDSHSSQEIVTIFQRLNEEQNITVILVTHEPEIAAHTHRIVRLADGCVVDDAVVPKLPQLGVQTLADTPAGHNLVTEGA
jgi:putative ABC transport system ATP-binding protein